MKSVRKLSVKIVCLFICILMLAVTACRQSSKTREAGNAPATSQKTDHLEHPTSLPDSSSVSPEDTESAYVEEYELIKPDRLPALDTIDVSQFFWEESEYLGMIGDDIRRMDVVFLSMNRISAREYEVTGKSKVKDNICDFKGVMEAQSIVEEIYDPLGPSTIDGTIIGIYRFEEDTAQFGTGVFEGTFEILWAYYDDDHNDSVDYADIRLADIWYTDGHTYLFDGEWKSYKTGALKKACWTDGKACFPDDFDRSDGPDLIPDEKYRSAGWGSLIDIFSTDQEARTKAEKELRKNERWWKN